MTVSLSVYVTTRIEESVSLCMVCALYNQLVEEPSLIFTKTGGHGIVHGVWD